jgi:hypothetical protein
MTLRGRKSAIVGLVGAGLLTGAMALGAFANYTVEFLAVATGGGQAASSDYVLKDRIARGGEPDRQGSSDYTLRADFDFDDGPDANNGLAIGQGTTMYLTAIATPNLLEAQTRAKTARARADLRTIAAGLEAYAADQNDYPPNDGRYNVTPVQLTTPTAYLTRSQLIDPFSAKERLPDWVRRAHPDWDDRLARFYTYAHIVTFEEWQRIVSNRAITPPVEAVDGSYAD